MCIVILKKNTCSQVSIYPSNAPSNNKLLLIDGNKCISKFKVK